VSGGGLVATPSGAQHEIVRGGLRATVTEIGATLRALTLDGDPVVDGFGADEPSTAGRGQILAPWPNRLQDGRYVYEGREAKTPLNEPERGNAIHGLVRWLPWELTRFVGDGVLLRCGLEPEEGYPWRLELEVEYRLDVDGLIVVTTATNRSDVAAPFGLGFHPYLTVGTDLIDAARLEVPAARALRTDGRALPVGDEAVAGTPLDFMTPREIGDAQLDTAFTELARDDDGRAIVTLVDPAGARRVTLWADEAFGYLMVYTGDTLEPVARRRRGIAIEPMTCPPNALRSGVDVIRLEPARPWSASWGIAPEGHGWRTADQPAASRSAKIT
jgi:aldose 1-epimerase